MFTNTIYFVLSLTTSPFVTESRMDILVSAAESNTMMDHTIIRTQLAGNMQEFCDVAEGVWKQATPTLGVCEWEHMTSYVTMSKSRTLIIINKQE